MALAGAVDFVEIVAPGLVRPWTGHDPGRTLATSAWLGALLLVLADLVVRILPTDNELRLGVVAALAGAPVFTLIVLRRGRGRVTDDLITEALRVEAQGTPLIANISAASRRDS